MRIQCDCRACREKRGENHTITIAPEIRARRLLDHYADLSKVHAFKPGDVVVLKSGVDFFKHPQPGEPCVVLETLATPLEGAKDGSTEHGAKLDLRLLSILPENATLALNLYESRLFEPYTGPIEPGETE